jgi:putative cell wall-binding protein
VFKGFKSVQCYYCWGTGVVSTSIETTLKNMGISVDKIARKDRYATSLEVAKRLVDEFKRGHPTNYPILSGITIGIHMRDV